MNIRVPTKRLLIAAIGGAFPMGMPTAHAQGIDEEKLRHELDQSLWAAGIATTTRPGPPSVERSTRFSDLRGQVDAGAFETRQARWGRWGMQFDAVYVEPSTSRPDVDLKVSQQWYSLGGTWRAVEGRAPVDLIGGLRYNDVQPRPEASAASRSGTQRAWEPYVGIRGHLPLSPRWSLVGYADAGRFSGGNYRGKCWRAQTMLSATAP